MKILDALKNLRGSSVLLRPFDHVTPSLYQIGRWVLILLIPQIIMLIATRSVASLLVLLATVLGSVGAEVLYNLVKRQFSVSPLFALIQGIVIGLLLPSTYPPLSAFLITLVSLLLCNYAFGGFSASWINPLAITVAVAYILNFAVFPDYLLSAADVQTKNTALFLIQGGGVNVLSSDATITSFLNRTVFRLFGVVIPEGYVTLFWDTGSAIPAFRFNFITLLSSVVLISLDMVGALIPAVFLAVYALLVRFLGPVFVGGLPLQGDILLALLTSGTLFSTLYVLQWYGTTPVSTRGKILYALIAGVAAFLIMGYGTSPVGYMFLVLLMNVVSTLIQVLESKRTKRIIEKVIVPRLKRIKEEENV